MNIRSKVKRQRLRLRLGLGLGDRVAGESYAPLLSALQIVYCILQDAA